LFCHQVWQKNPGSSERLLKLNTCVVGAANQQWTWQESDAAPA